MSIEKNLSCSIPAQWSLTEIHHRELGRDRIWLDLFETNERVCDVYEQCGYRPFDKSEYQGRTLLLYDTAA